ncbi:MAG TPA: universal stress protein [Thermoanaerobaculia bacterium]|nr:universal stress protein [Thermoanaerobaculia bacterium]
MYQHIFVPVDNSGHSNRAADCAITLGRGFGARLTGCHVYAARMHDYRFKQMEYTLPEEYLVERELARQRKIHDSLITMGLELISDCYLNDLDQRCQQVGLECERKMMDGKHSTELLREIESNGYDLVVMGAVGIGRTRDSQVGSVTSRVAREATRDTWVVKHVPGKDEPERDTVMVGVDGSPESFGALMTALELAKEFGKKVEVVGVYDPYLHYAVFKGIVEVLTDRAAKVFRFEEQNQLHEEIIDTGLAQIYQSHINVAETMAREAGVEVTKTLLDGKAYQKLLDHARKVEPWVLVIGRVGVHRQDDEDGLGSNSENLLRLAPCDVLLTTRRVVPELDLKAEESIHWTPEAEERMGRVPEQVKGIARTAILRLAMEHGHSVVSSDLVTEAMERFMPKRSAKLTEKLAEALAIDKARREAVSVCRACGVAARVPDPAVCTVCGGQDFEVVEPEVLDRIAALEGGVEEETTYDGRSLAWTQEAKKALRAIDDRYQRRRAKARIEKAAHGKRISPITLDFAQRFVAEETGVLYKPAAGAAPSSADVERILSEARDAHDAVHAAAAEKAGNGAATNGVAENGQAVNGAGKGAPAVAAEDDEPEIKIVARDGAGNPLVSRFGWTADAVPRILRVPAGFMRDRTQGRVEELAAEKGVATIDLALVEEGIEHGKQMMAEMLGQYQAAPPQGSAKAAEAAQPAAAEGGECPVDPATVGQAEGSQQAAGRSTSSRPTDPAALGLALNEVSVLAQVEARRREMGGTGAGANGAAASDPGGDE